MRRISPTAPSCMNFWRTVDCSCELRGHFRNNISLLALIVAECLRELMSDREHSISLIIMSLLAVSIFLIAVLPGILPEFQQKIAIAKPLVSGMIVTATCLSVSVQEQYIALDDHLSTSTILILTMLPIVLDAVFPSVSWNIVVVFYVISSGFLMGNIIAYHAVGSILPVVIGMAMSGIALTARRSNLEQWMEEAARVTTDYVSEAKHTVKETLTASKADEWRNLLSNIAHDMNTPLSAMYNGIDILLNAANQLRFHCPSSDSADTEILGDHHHMPTLDHLPNVMSAILNLRNISDYMAMMIHRCVDYAKASHGVRLVPFIEAVNVWDCLTRAVDCIQDLQRNHTIDVESSIPSLHSSPLGKEVMCFTDRQWFFESILCLLSNAAKHGVSTGRISVRLQVLHSSNHEDQCHTGLSSCTAPCILVEVENGGQDIPRDIQDILFNEEFCHMRRLSGGSGMGLYTLARRCEALGGSYGYRARSDGQQGTVFWFAIPFKPVHSPQPSPPSSPLHLHDISSAMTPLHILVVDDSIPVNKMVSRILEHDGHHVTTAFNGLDAMNIVQSTLKLIDVILMDIQMPVMDGLEATRQIRLLQGAQSKMDTARAPSPSVAFNPLTAPATPHEPLSISNPETPVPESDELAVSIPVYHLPHQSIIIGCSANADDRTMDDAYAAGVDGFLPKPFNLQRFKKLVDQHLH